MIWYLTSNHKIIVILTTVVYCYQISLIFIVLYLIMGKCKFQHTWLQKVDSLGCISEWCKKKEDDCGYCIPCENTFNANKGYQAVMQHVKFGKHEKKKEH
jgi:hypothetical protein